MDSNEVLLPTVGFSLCFVQHFRGDNGAGFCGVPGGWFVKQISFDKFLEPFLKHFFNILQPCCSKNMEIVRVLAKATSMAPVGMQEPESLMALKSNSAGTDWPDMGRL